MDTHNWFVGVDPGRTGCIALLAADRKAGVKYWRMPKTVSDLWDLLAAIKVTTEGDQLVCLEKVGARPTDSSRGAFTFGQGVGHLEMAIHGLQLLPCVTARPQKWQGDMECLTKGDKEITRQKAQQLFPGLKIPNKNDADGVCIAWYARHKYGGKAK